MAWSEWKRLGKPTKFENIPFTSTVNTNGSNYYYTTGIIDISTLYPNYKNITIDNIVIEFTHNNIYGETDIVKSYNPDNGQITLVASSMTTANSGGFGTNPTSNRFNVYIF